MRSEIKKGIAIGNYNSQFATYLSFKKGDIIVLEAKEGEFWRGRLGAHIGLVSQNYIKEIENQPVTGVATVTNNNINNNINQVSQPTFNSSINNHINKNNNNNNGSSPITTPTKQEDPKEKIQPTQPQIQQDEDEAIAKKIRDSFTHFQSKEELLEAIQNLAIKFVKQSSVLKKELAQEQAQRKELEEELKFIKHKHNLL
ncbi:hypothetical protein DICPUDRAFT_93208 [Dictyostelium purpureum]|uniref:SH3 domain-containing protein n=1 Tax=Dictyostelium purpureum TaxID=5786 RepID=F1A3Y4_DICPU|nr:uncharacterized protein DICPUDRAFT_93208 [Dictyostelium purpureum]EGC29090.1 hypothetical protein DICPUDRAFT_93208 [Dictyostelium purpureum]|eukprot:XP_003294378.1 hypothetical protein DICPUDRAFT_93208 [Dictyostelium purpureum]